MYRYVLGWLLLVGCGDNIVARQADRDAGPIDIDAAVVSGDADAGDAALGRTIGGNALGIRGAVALDVVIGGSDISQVLVTQDGAWQLAGTFAAGSTYAVATADPDCAIVGGAGTISPTADVTDIALYCIGVVELSSVGFDPSVIALAPAFQPAAVSYGGIRPLFMEESDPLAITPVASYPTEAEIRVHGVLVPSGEASSPAPLGTMPLSIVVTHAATSLTRTYEFTPERSERLEAYIKASDSIAGIRFSGGTGVVNDTGCGLSSNGNAVALSGDVLVVGAPCANGRAGAAYVYRRTNTTWMFEAKLAPAALASGDQFGAAVAIDGDRIAIGAPYDDTTRAGSGAVYVFERTAIPIAPWSEVAKLKASNAGTDDSFGLAVGIAGDTIVVGAPAEDSDAVGVGGNGNNNKTSSAGAAYVYVRDTVLGGWSQQAYLKASNTGANDVFGTAVAVSGDRIVVGAPGEDGPTDLETDAGAAWVFVRVATTWAQEGAVLRASNHGGGDAFGRAVSISGDRLAIGAPGEGASGSAPTDDSAPYAGASYVFARSGSTWSEEQYVKATSPAAGDRFGSVVAIDGDHLVVGALDALGRAGEAFACRRGSTTAPFWNEVRAITAPNGEAGDLFGASVALDGDTFAFGAFGEDSVATGVSPIANDNGAIGAGAVYVFR
jgi:hypothetical protein